MLGLSRNDKDTIAIAEQDVAWPYAHRANLDRDPKVDHLSARPLVLSV